MFPTTVFQKSKVISCQCDIKIQKHMYSMWRYQLNDPNLFFWHTAYKNKKPNFTLLKNWKACSWLKCEQRVIEETTENKNHKPTMLRFVLGSYSDKQVSPKENFQINWDSLNWCPPYTEIFSKRRKIYSFCVKGLSMHDMWLMIKWTWINFKKTLPLYNVSTKLYYKVTIF